MGAVDSVLRLVIDAKDNATGDLKKVTAEIDRVAQANARLGEIDKQLAAIRKDEVSAMTGQRAELAKLRDERKALVLITKEGAAADKAAKAAVARASQEALAASERLAQAERQIARELNEISIAASSNAQFLTGIAKAEAELADVEAKMNFLRKQSIDLLQGEAREAALLAEAQKKAADQVRALAKAEKDAADSVRKAESEAAKARAEADKQRVIADKASLEAAAKAELLARASARAQNDSAIAAASNAGQLKGMARLQAEAADAEKRLEFARQQNTRAMTEEEKALDDLERAQKKASAALKEAQDAQERHKAIVSGAMQAIAGAALAAGAAFIAYSKHVADGAVELSKLSAKTNVTVEELSVLEDVARKTGTPMEALAETFGILQKKAFENPQAFARLGIAVRDAGGKIKSGTLLFSEMSDALNTVTDDAEKLTIAQGLIEDKYKDVAGAIRLGSKGIQDSAEQLAAAGAITTTEFARQAVAFDEMVAGLNNKLKGYTIKVLTGIGSSVEAYKGNMLEAEEASAKFSKRTDLSNVEKFGKGIALGARAMLGIVAPTEAAGKAAERTAKQLKELGQTEFYTIKPVTIKENEATLKRQNALVDALKSNVASAMDSINSVASAALSKQKAVADEFFELTKRVKVASGEGKLTQALDAVGRKAKADKAQKDQDEEAAEKDAANVAAYNLSVIQANVDAAEKAYAAKATASNKAYLEIMKNDLAQEKAAQSFEAAELERAKKRKAIYEIEDGQQRNEAERRGTRDVLNAEYEDVAKNVEKNIKSGSDQSSELKRLTALGAKIEENRRNATEVFTQKEADDFAEKLRVVANEASASDAKLAGDKAAEQLAKLKKEFGAIDIKWSDESLKKSVDELLKSIDAGLSLKEFKVSIRPSLLDNANKGFADAKNVIGLPSYDIVDGDNVVVAAPNVSSSLASMKNREVNPQFLSAGTTNAAAAGNAKAVGANWTIDLTSAAGTKTLEPGVPQSDIDEYIRQLRRSQS